MRRTFSILALLAGCGSSGAPALPDGAGPPPGDRTDMEWCQQSCDALIACGVAYDNSCASTCLASPAFLACLKTTARECSPLAVCAFRQSAVTVCGGQAAGTPAGHAPCKAAADCEASCTMTDMPPSCNCKCWAVLAPEKAVNLLINNECSKVQCKTECAAGGSGAVCLKCFNEKCQSESAQCRAI